MKKFHRAFKTMSIAFTNDVNIIEVPLKMVIVNCSETTDMYCFLVHTATKLLKFMAIQTKGHDNWL